MAVKRARTVTFVVCQRCGKPIENPEGGVIVHGNIYAATPEVGRGLVGDNFPHPAPVDPECVERFDVRAVVGESAYCIGCFIEILTSGNQKLVPNVPEDSPKAPASSPERR